jgi:hypothetical protein
MVYPALACQVVPSLLGAWLTVFSFQCLEERFFGPDPSAVRSTRTRWSDPNPSTTIIPWQVSSVKYPGVGQVLRKLNLNFTNGIQ